MFGYRRTLGLVGPKPRWDGLEPSTKVITLHVSAPATFSFFHLGICLKQTSMFCPPARPGPTRPRERRAPLPSPPNPTTFPSRRRTRSAPPSIPVVGSPRGTAAPTPRAEPNRGWPTLQACCAWTARRPGRSGTIWQSRPCWTGVSSRPGHRPTPNRGG